MATSRRQCSPQSTEGGPTYPLYSPQSTPATEPRKSIPEVYGLFVVYDASAQFSAPAEYVSDQRWEYPDPIDWYEGTSAPVGGAFPTWTGVTAGQRDWKLDRAPGTIRCEIVTFSGFYSFEDWGEDNNRFAVASEARATSGTVRLSFNSPPDFEAPADEDGGQCIPVYAW